jgi:hypothetical protein
VAGGYDIGAGNEEGVEYSEPNPEYSEPLTSTAMDAHRNSLTNSAEYSASLTLEAMYSTTIGAAGAGGAATDDAGAAGVGGDYRSLAIQGGGAEYAFPVEEVGGSSVGGGPVYASTAAAEGAPIYAASTASADAGAGAGGAPRVVQIYADNAFTPDSDDEDVVVAPATGEVGGAAGVVLGGDGRRPTYLEPVAHEDYVYGNVDALVAEGFC